MQHEDKAAVEIRDTACSTETAAYRAPGYTSVSLACEISAYAPDSDTNPLF